MPTAAMPTPYRPMLIVDVENENSEPKKYASDVPVTTDSTGNATDNMPSPTPPMMTVAGPVFEAAAMR